MILCFREGLRVCICRWFYNGKGEYGVGGKYDKQVYDCGGLRWPVAGDEVFEEDIKQEGCGYSGEL